MKTSKDRILTTHTGSLPRPKALAALILARETGGTVDAAIFEAETAKAVDDVVAKQVAAGIDVVSDGEMSKPSYTTYIRHRVSGIAADPRAAEKGRDIMIGRNMLEHPDFAQQRGNFSNVPFPGCVGELRYKDRSGLERDLAHLKAAADSSRPAEVFMTAPSPGILTRFIINLHYPSEDAYLAALTDVMQTEYRAVVEAGFLLQIDAPHTHDLPLTRIIDIAYKARPQAISIEAANPRHDHEWEDMQAVKVPEDKILIPGVIDSTNNFVEHPRLVAQRLLRYAQFLDRERLIAGIDCGFGTAVRREPKVTESIVWAKLRALHEGAALASKRLWGS